MRYSPKQYAHALYETLQHKHGDAFSDCVKKFLDVLKKGNALKLLPKILREMEKMEEGNVVDVASARPLSNAVRVQLQAQFAGARIKEKTAPELLSGAVVTWDDWRVDGSVRGRLIKLEATTS